MKATRDTNVIQLRQTKQKFINPEGDFAGELGSAVQSLPPLYTRLLAGGICLIFTSAVSWATFNQVDEVADTQGQFLANSYVLPMRAPISGSIKNINVSERQHVEEGDVLVELDPAMSEAEVQRLGNIITLKGQELARLKAEHNGTKTRGTSLQNQLLTSRLKDYEARRDSAIAEANGKKALIEKSKIIFSRLQQNINNAEKKVRNANINIINAKNIREKAVETAPKIASSLDIAQDKEKSFDLLAKQGVVARLQHSQAVGEVIKANVELIRINAEITKSSDEVTNMQNKVSEAEDNLTSLQKDAAAQSEEIRQAEQSYRAALKSISRIEAERKNEIIMEMNKLNQEITDLDGQYSQAKEQRNKNIIKAPISGYTYNVKVNHTLGNVQSGDELFSIVPNGEKLILEVKVQNKDIGFVKENMSAKVKLATYPYHEFGILNGTVEKVSRNALSDKDGNLFYTARINVNQQSAKGKIENVVLTPGMVATAEIVIRQKKVISFLLEPIITNWDRAFSVR